MSDVDRDAVAAALPFYEIEGELGRGGWGVVLAARHRQLNRDVAVKQLPPLFGADPAVRARFVAEARVLASFEHPHIVPIYDYIEHDNLCVLVMERLTGGTVWSRAKAGGFTPQQACALVLAACAGLHYAHQRGVLHRDVKPENLMFSSAGVLKVSDFGLAKVVGGAATVATRAGDVLGTPAYMAPEQAKGDELSAATDIYAIGTVLYQLLCGQLPFPADSNPIAMLYRHVHEEPIPLLHVAPHLPPALAEVTARSLERDPLRRYPDAEHMAVALAEAAAMAWGERWLPATGTTVTATGPVLSAAVGQRDEIEETLLPGFAAPLETPSRDYATPSGLVPVHSLRDLMVSRETGAPAGSPISPVRPTVAPPASPPMSPPMSPPVSSDPGGFGVTMGAPPPRAATPPVAPMSPGGGGGGKRRLPLVIGAVVLVAAVIAAAVTFLGGDKKPASVEVATARNLVPGEWTPGPSAPLARQQLGVAAAEGAIWVLGGITDNQSTAAVEKFDPGKGAWSKGPDLPLPLHHEMAVAYQGHVVALGGWLPVGGSLTAATSDRVFELRANKWKELAKLPHPRAAGAAAVVGDKIVVFGGQASGRLVPETDIFDGKTWTSGAPLGTPRDHLAGTSDGKHVYAIGGRDLSPDKNLDAVERYDPVTNAWEPLAPLPTPRGDISAASIAGRVIVAGGETSTTVFNTVDALDTESLTWAPGPTMPTPRHGLGLVAAGSSLYAIDGALKPGHSASASTLETLAFTSSPGGSSSQWQPARAAPTPRQQAATAVDAGTVWVMGGLTAEGGATVATTKVEGYDPTIDTWKKGPDLPVALHDAMATNYKGELVVLGGWVSEGNRLKARVSDRAYALRQGNWVDLPPLKTPRAAGAASVVGPRLVLVGGEGRNGLVPTTEIFDGRDWTFGIDIPTPRTHVAAASDGHFLFVVGGRVSSANDNLAAVDRYDPDARLWEQLPDMPTARGALGASIVDGRLYAVGGETPNSVLDTVEVFDVRGRSWSAGPPLKTPRHSPSVDAIGSTVFALGGGTAPGGGAPSPVSEVLRTK